MDVALTLVRYESKAVLARLIELYSHDLSEFYENVQLNEHGLYGYRHLDHYWTDEGRYPYFITVDQKLAGFVLVRDSKDMIEFAEFFVLRNFRNQGVGAAAARASFKLHPGRWGIWHATANAAASALWRSVVPPSAEPTVEGFETIYRFDTSSDSRNLE